MKTSIHLTTMLLAMLASGCTTNEGPYVPTQQTPSTELENTTVILDREIANHIAVDLQDAERAHSGKLIARANIRNRTNHDLRIQVQTVFRDSKGFSINDDTAWETLVLTANETHTISAISTSKKAERYTIRIRMMR